jgi:hypothetical protein
MSRSTPTNAKAVPPTRWCGTLAPPPPRWQLRPRSSRRRSRGFKSLGHVIGPCGSPPAAPSARPTCGRWGCPGSQPADAWAGHRHALDDPRPPGGQRCDQRQPAAVPECARPLDPAAQPRLGEVTVALSRWMARRRTRGKLPCQRAAPPNRTSSAWTIKPVVQRDAIARND